MGIPGYTQIPFKNPGTYPSDLSWVGYPPDLPLDTYPGTRCPTLTIASKSGVPTGMAMLPHHNIHTFAHQLRIYKEDNYEDTNVKVKTS